MLSWDFLHCLFVKSQFPSTQKTPKPLFKTISYLVEFSIFLSLSPQSLKKMLKYQQFSLWFRFLTLWWFLTLEISHTKGSNISLEWLSTFLTFHQMKNVNFWIILLFKKLSSSKSKKSLIINFKMKTLFSKLEMKKLCSKLER